MEPLFEPLSTHKHILRFINGLRFLFFFFPKSILLLKNFSNKIGFISSGRGTSTLVTWTWNWGILVSYHHFSVVYSTGLTHLWKCIKSCRWSSLTILYPSLGRTQEHKRNCTDCSTVEGKQSEKNSKQAKANQVSRNQFNKWAMCAFRISLCLTLRKFKHIWIVWTNIDKRWRCISIEICTEFPAFLCGTSLG